MRRLTLATGTDPVLATVHQLRPRKASSDRRTAAARPAADSYLAGGEVIELELARGRFTRRGSLWHPELPPEGNAA